MATVGSLVVNLILANAQYLRQLAQTTNATGAATRNMQASMAALATSFKVAGAGLAAVFVARGLQQAVVGLAHYSDAWKMASNQIAAADSLSGKQARSMQGILRIAAETRSSLQETAELYARVLRSTESVAKSEDEVAKFTTIAAKAFKVQGASMQETVNGMRQLSQAMASGILQGDELRSVRENATLLAEAIAKEFNTTVGELKQLGAEGKLTADRVFKAVITHGGPITAAFEKTNGTIAESFVQLDNAITGYVGKMDKALGVSKAFNTAIIGLANNLDGLADSFLFVKEIGLIVENIQLAMQVFDKFGKDVDDNGQAILGRWKDWTKASDEFTESLSDLVGVDIDYWIQRANKALTSTNPFARLTTFLKDVNKELKELDDGFRKSELALQRITEIAKKTQPRLFTFPKTFAPTADFGTSPEELRAKFDAAREMESRINQMGLLSDAAKQGQEAFDLLTDMLGAFNDAIKVGNPLVEGLAQDLMVAGFEARQLARLDAKTIAFGQELTDVKNSIDQYRSLSVALSQNSTEYRALKDHLDLVNEAAQKNIDISTTQGKAWMAQREAAQQLEHALERQKELYDEVANAINSTVTAALGSVSSAFADAIVQGENFRDMLDALLKDLAKLALNAAFQLFLKQIIGGIGTTGAAGTGLLGMLMGGVGGGALGQGGLPLVPGGTFGDTLVPQAMGSTIQFHRGGIVGKEGSPFAGLPRFHNGLMPNEFPAVLNKGEGVFTKEQMKALGGGKGEININIDNRNGSSVQAKGERDENGDVNIEMVIDQVVGRKLLQPGAASNRAMKQGFGAQPVGIRR